MNNEKIQKRYNLLIGDEKLKKSHINDFKSLANNLMDKHWVTEISDFCIGKTKENVIFEDIYWLSRPQLHNLNSIDKKLQTLLKVNPGDGPDVQHIKKSISILNEFRKYESMHNELKTALLEIPKKIQQKKEQEENKPSFKANKQTIDKIKATLYEKCLVIREKMNEKYKSSLSAIIDDFLLIPESKRKSSIWYNYYSKRPEAVSIINSLTHKGMPIDKMEDKIEKMAKDSVDMVVDTFVFKQADKLSGVLQGMPEPSSINIGLYVNEAIEGVINVSFKDGRSFDLLSQIVVAESVKGNIFSRYPSTFHDIKDEDGKLVAKMMSEVDIQAWSKKEESFNYSI